LVSLEDALRKRFGHYATELRSRRIQYVGGKTEGGKQGSESLATEPGDQTEFDPGGQVACIAHTLASPDGNSIRGSARYLPLAPAGSFPLPARKRPNRRCGRRRPDHSALEAAVSLGSGHAISDSPSDRRSRRWGK